MAPTIVNYVNLISFGVNIFMTYFSNTGIFGNTNSTVSNDYQTILTPAGYTFSIWGLIFTCQAIFTIAQFLPAYSSSALVGTKSGFVYFWAAACLFQSAWSVAFVCLQLVLSSVFIILIALSLAGVVYGQARSQEQLQLEPTTSNPSSKSWMNNSWVEYFLLIFPFRVHFAWVCAASIVNVNIDFVSEHAGDLPVLSACAIVSVAVLVFFSATVKHATTEVFCVFSWAFGGIASELSHADAKVVDVFGTGVVEGFRRAAVALAIFFAIIAIPSFFIRNSKDTSFDYKKAPTSKINPELSRP